MNTQFKKNRALYTVLDTHGDWVLTKRELEGGTTFEITKLRKVRTGGYARAGIAGRYPSDSKFGMMDCDHNFGGTDCEKWAKSSWNNIKNRDASI